MMALFKIFPLLISIDLLDQMLSFVFLLKTKTSPKLLYHCIINFIDYIMKIKHSINRRKLLKSHMKDFSYFLNSIAKIMNSIRISKKLRKQL